MLRSQGVEGLQNQIRLKVKLAKKFEELVLSGPRLKLFCKTIFGLVCFGVAKDKEGREYSLEEANAESKRIVEQINKERKFHVIGCTVLKAYFVRVVVSSHLTKNAHLEAFLKRFCELFN